MKRKICLTISLLGLSMPAMAAPPAALQPGIVHIVEQIGQPSDDAVILFAASLEGHVGGAVVSQDGTVLCDDAWRAHASGDGTHLQFDEIAVTADSCVADGSLMQFIDRLGAVDAVTTTDDGVMLLDSSGQPLLRLMVAG